LLNLKKKFLKWKIKSSSSLKAVIAVLAVLLVGLIYIFKVTSGKTVQTELKSTMTDKELVMKDLQELKRRTM
jgi:hypothetical protein